MKLIIAGSEGLLGEAIADDFEAECCVEYLKHKIIRLDKALGHDLTDEPTVCRLMKEHAPNAQCLINTFALNPQPGDNDFNIFTIPLESFRAYLEVNGTALFSICRRFAESAPWGSRIINFASTYGVVAPNPHLYDRGIKHPAYSFTKAGVIGLTRWLAAYLAPRISVNCIVPGGVENGQSQDFLTRYACLTPMQRMAKKEEIVSVVRFLVEKAPAYLTGAILTVDGGYTTW